MEENGKRRKKQDHFLENFAKENGKMSSPICWIKKQLFLVSTSQQDSKKCENWRNHFSRFFSAKIFFKKTK